MQFNEYPRLCNRFGVEASNSWRQYYNQIKIFNDKRGLPQKFGPADDGRIANKSYGFAQMITHKENFGDLTADLSNQPYAHNLRKSLCDAMELCSDSITLDAETGEASEQFFDMWSAIIDSAGTEQHWHIIKRPYYNVYPIVYEDLLDNIDLSKIEWDHIQFPCSPLLLKFPVGREPYGISTLMIRRNLPDERGSDFTSMCHSPMEWDRPDLSPNDPMVRDGKVIVSANRVKQCQPDLHDVGKHMINLSSTSQLEYEIQWAESPSPLCHQRVTVMDSIGATSVADCIENTELRDLMVESEVGTEFGRYKGDENTGKVKSLDEQFKGRARIVKTGHALLLVDDDDNEVCPEEYASFRKTMNEFLIKMAAAVSMIHQSDGMVTRTILESDRNKYEASDEDQRRFLEDKAAKKTGCRGHDLGRTLQEEKEKHHGNPHYVAPFLRLQPYGPKNSLRKIITVTGHMRGIAHLDAVPTGFEGTEQPKQPEYKYRPPVSPALRAKVLARDKYTCKTCGRKPEDGIKLEAGHIISDKNGGKASLDNLITQCDVCNRGQSSRNINKEAVA